MKNKKYLLFLIPILLLALLGGYSVYQAYRPSLTEEATNFEDNSSQRDVVSPVNVAPIPIPESPTPTPFPEYDITLMALGDNLMHMGVINSGRQADSTYDYSFLFENIVDFLDSADIKVINQETIFAGNQLGFSGYPRFNSPTEVGDAIASAGFNVVLHASNHAGDKDISGLLACASYWSSHPQVKMLGIHENKRKSDESTNDNIEIMDIDGYTFALLNYTYGANMEILPLSFDGHLDMLCNYDRKTGQMDFTSLNPDVISDIEQAETMADIVIVFPHWGTEYQTSPSSYQEKFAEQMTEAGADVIIGTHPHVIQPVKWITSDNGNKSLCFYSLGNYVSTQKNPLCMLEAMAYVSFRVTEDGISILEKNTGAIPMVCHYTSDPVRVKNVYLLENYTKELANDHGILSYGGVPLIYEDLQKWTEEILGDSLLSSDVLADKLN